MWASVANAGVACTALLCILSAVGTSACRDYGTHDATPEAGRRSQGGAGLGGASGAAETGGDGAADTGAGASGGSGGVTGQPEGPRGGKGGRRSADPAGGSSARAAGGESGAGAATGGESGDGGNGGNGGNGGSAGAQPPPPPLPGQFGAVRLFVAGKPACTGTLIHNRWVLTADHCLPEGTEPSAIGVGYGSDAKRFAQTRAAVEIERFPTNGAGDRTRDLALIGVDAPFAIEGSFTNHHYPTYAWEDVYPWVTGLRCVGWDMSPDPESPTDTLRVVDFHPLEVKDQPDGRVVWWENSLPSDPLHGNLPAGTDAGGGCFFAYGSSWFLASVNTSNPSSTHSGKPNDNQEAYALTLREDAIQGWLEQVLFRTLPSGVETDSDWHLAGPVDACSPSADTIQLFGVKTDGSMGVFRRSASAPDWQGAATWMELPSVPAPSATSLRPLPPGVLCWPNGGVELVATGSDGDFYWQHRDASTAPWLPDWQKASSGGDVASGVSLAGVMPGFFEAFTRSSSDDSLFKTVFDNGWGGPPTRIEAAFLGTPHAHMATSEWDYVFVRILGGAILSQGTVGGSLSGWYEGIVGLTSPSDPAIASARPDRVDVLVRSNGSTLEHYALEVWFNPSASDTGLSLPDGELSATARERGQLDVFVTGGGGPLWHAVWPRDPEATPVSKVRQPKSGKP